MSRRSGESEKLKHLLWRLIEGFSQDGRGGWCTRAIDDPRLYELLRQEFPSLTTSVYRRILRRTMESNANTVDSVLKTLLLGEIRKHGRRKWPFQEVLKRCANVECIQRPFGERVPDDDLDKKLFGLSLNMGRLVSRNGVLCLNGGCSMRDAAKEMCRRVELAFQGVSQIGFIAATTDYLRYKKTAVYVNPACIQVMGVNLEEEFVLTLEIDSYDDVTACMASTLPGRLIQFPVARFKNPSYPTVEGSREYVTWFSYGYCADGMYYGWSFSYEENATLDITEIERVILQPHDTVAPCSV